MNDFFLILFITSAALLVHSYLLYPPAMALITSFIKREYRKNPDYEPKVSVVISAFNEEKVIEKTIRNLFKSNYNKDKIQVVIGSDKSSDNTNNIVIELSEEFDGIKFLPFEKRRGKARVLNDLLEAADGKIVLFCDANTIYHPDAINHLVSHFADERVGGVSGKLMLLDTEKSLQSAAQEKTYWEYETFVKRQEAKAGYLIGANGGIYAIRKELFRKLPVDVAVCDDFYITMQTIRQSKYFLFDESALAFEHTAPDIKSEFKRKTRIQAQNLSAIREFAGLLFSKKVLVSFGLWSHKIIRWFTPLLLIAMITSSAFLSADYQLFVYFNYAVLGGTALSLLGALLSLLRVRFEPLLVGYYFLVVNLSFLLGLFYFIINKKFTSHQPTPR